MWLTVIKRKRPAHTWLLPKHRSSIAALCYPCNCIGIVCVCIILVISYRQCTMPWWMKRNRCSCHAYQIWYHSISIPKLCHSTMCVDTFWPWHHYPQPRVQAGEHLSSAWRLPKLVDWAWWGMTEPIGPWCGSWRLHHASAAAIWALLPPPWTTAVMQTFVSSLAPSISHRNHADTCQQLSHRSSLLKALQQCRLWLTGWLIQPLPTPQPRTHALWAVPMTTWPGCKAVLATQQRDNAAQKQMLCLSVVYSWRRPLPYPYLCVYLKIRLWRLIMLVQVASCCCWQASANLCVLTHAPCHKHVRTTCWLQQLSGFTLQASQSRQMKPTTQLTVHTQSNKTCETKPASPRSPHQACRMGVSHSVCTLI